MKAMRIHASCSLLRLDELTLADPGPGEVLVRVKACGVCRTDLSAGSARGAARICATVPEIWNYGKMAT
jgi:D-arabinose 1-dehydrogenase-like Zn-dependent alcohol dehydrogenase